MLESLDSCFYSYNKTLLKGDVPNNAVITLHIPRIAFFDLHGILAAADNIHPIAVMLGLVDLYT